jgi:hypothetical protein
VVNGNGQVLSGFDTGTSVFDKRLRSDPPPHFLAIDRPTFRGYRIVSGGAPGAAGDEAGGWPVIEIPIGQLERDAAGAMVN